MTQNRPPDPVQPQVTFDNYVIPETVRSHQVEQPILERMPRFQQLSGFQVNTTFAAVAAIGALTFVLGILVTLQFTQGRSDQTVNNPALTNRSPLIDQENATGTVTRLAPTDLLSTSAAAPADDMVPDLKAAVLKGLQPKRTVGKLTLDEMAQKSLEAQDIVNRNKMRMLREGVLAGVYRVETQETDGAKRLALRTVNAPMTQTNTANLLQAAAKRGEIDLSASLNTSDGTLDQDTLLFTLIQTSLATDGTPEGAEAAREMGRRAFAASSAQTREVKGARVYEVKRGDSLAYISLQFYGRPNDYMRIFQANQDKLRSPDRIKIGQRLIIPE